MSTDITLEDLNKTELLQILAKKSNGGHRLRDILPKDRLVHLINTGEQPREDEISQTAKTRKQLQLWIETRWKQVSSQLPCIGTTKGKCTIHSCSEGRHLACYTDADGQDHIV